MIQTGVIHYQEADILDGLRVPVHPNIIEEWAPCRLFLHLHFWYHFFRLFPRCRGGWFRGTLFLHYLCSTKVFNIHFKKYIPDVFAKIMNECGTLLTFVCGNYCAPKTGSLFFCIGICGRAFFFFRSEVLDNGGWSWWCAGLFRGAELLEEFIKKLGGQKKK